MLEATWLGVKSRGVSAWIIGDVVALIIGDPADISGIQQQRALRYHHSTVGLIKFRSPVIAGTTVVGIAPPNTEVIKKVVLISIDSKSEIGATVCIKETCISSCSLLCRVGNFMLEENRLGKPFCTN